MAVAVALDDDGRCQVPKADLVPGTQDAAAAAAAALTIKDS